MIKSLFKKEKNKFFFLVAIFYLTGNWLLLLNQGVYWDDWMIYNMDIQGIYEQFYGNGSPYFGYLHYWLNQIPNAPLIYHWLVVIFQLSTMYILLEIIDLLELKNSGLLYIVVGLSALIPYFSAKVTMICFPYVLCYFLFFLAFYLAILSFKRENVVFRIVALLIFFISFTTNSLLVFFLIPFCTLFFLKQREDRGRGWDPRDFLKNILHISDFLVLPFAFFAIKKSFFSTQGVNALIHYNELTFNGILNSPLLIITTFKNSFVELLIKILSLLKNQTITFLIIWFTTGSLIHFVTNLKFSNFNYYKSKYNCWYLLAIGVILFIIGSFPYAAVNKVPSLQSYYDRFQLLLPLGCSFIFVAIIFGITEKKHIRQILLSFVVASFIFINFKYQLQYTRGWLKMESIIENLPLHAYVQENSTFLVLDNVEQWDATEKDIDFHAWNGMFKKTWGDENRFAIEYQNFDEIMDNIDLYLMEATRLNMKNYIPSEPDAVIEVKEGNYSLPILNTIHMLLNHYFDPVAYQKNVKDIVSIKVWPCFEIDNNYQLQLKENDCL